MHAIVLTSHRKSYIYEEYSIDLYEYAFDVLDETVINYFDACVCRVCAHLHSVVDISAEIIARFYPAVSTASYTHRVYLRKQRLS